MTNMHQFKSIKISDHKLDAKVGKPIL